MGFFEKIGLVEATVEEPAPVEQEVETEVQVDVDCGDFEFKAEDIVSVIKQKLAEAGFPLDSLQQFQNYTATLPDTMGDDAKAKTLSSILTVSGVSMVSVADDIRAYDDGLVNTATKLEADCEARVAEATELISQHKKAIEELQKKIEATQAYRLTASACIEAERKNLEAVSSFALLVSNGGAK